MQRVFITAIAAFVSTVQGHLTSSFDLEHTTVPDQLPVLTCNELNHTTWLPVSVRVDLLPVKELRVVVSDRKHITVHVTVVAPPSDRSTNCDNSTTHGYFNRFNSVIIFADRF